MFGLERERERERVGFCDFFLFLSCSACCLCVSPVSQAPDDENAPTRRRRRRRRRRQLSLSLSLSLGRESPGRVSIGWSRLFSVCACCELPFDFDDKAGGPRRAGRVRPRDHLRARAARALSLSLSISDKGEERFAKGFLFLKLTLFRVYRIRKALVQSEETICEVVVVVKTSLPVFRRRVSACR